MTRKDFIRLADEISLCPDEWTVDQRDILIRALQRSNPNFDRERFMMRAGWLG